MRRSLVFCVCFSFMLLIAGCGRGSFIGKRLDNFSAYYNTFYNAEKALDEGVDGFSTGLEQQPIDQNLYISIFGRVESGTTQRKPFEDAIKKSADILREHPDSKWVDDAMMVIGRSWFFTQNYVGAEQYFREVMALESGLRDEARFWLARCLIASGQYDLAFDHLQESLSRDDLTRRWEATLRLAMAELHVKRKSWEDAATELETGLETVRDNELASRSQFLLGQVYETLERYEDAIAAYDRVGAYKPFYELSYAAQYSAVRVEGEHGDPEIALRRLRRMERDDKNYHHRGELAFMRARVLQAAGYYDDALDVYYELLYDPTADGAAVRGETHYALGSFYRDVYADFPYAAAYFDTAQTALVRPTSSGFGRSGGGASQPSYAPAAITDGEEQARVFLSFSEVMDEIVRMDSLLYLGSLDDSTFDAKILELRKQRAEELEAERREMERLRAERQFQQGGTTTPNNNTFGRTPAGKQIGNAADNNSGFLFHRDAVRVQEALAEFNVIWGPRPLVPNWRRLDAVNNVGSEGGSFSDSTLAEVISPEDELPEVDISDIPRDSLSEAIMLEDRANARYELANVLFLSMNKPDSAATWYRMVIEQDGEEVVAQRAYYALAEVQRALGDTLPSERLYRTIVDRYPDSDFSKPAAERLGRELADEASSDTLAMAEQAYDSVYTAWQQEDYSESLSGMVKVAIEYPETEVAPRALLAAGSVYMEWADRDSLDLYGALPLTLPDSILYQSDLFRPEIFVGDLVVDSMGVAPIDTAAVAPDDSPLKQKAPPSEDTETPVKQIDSVPVKQLDETPVKQIDSVPATQLDEPDAIDDTLAVAMETATPADSTLVSPDSVRVAPDPVGFAEPEPITLITLYEKLTSRYATSQQAPYAGRVLTALNERLATMQAIADSLAADSLARLDSLAGNRVLAAADTLVQEAPAPSDTLANESTTRVAEEAAPDSSAAPREKAGLLRSFDDERDQAREARPTLPEEVVDWTQPGYTLVLASELQRRLADRKARRFAQNLRRRSIPVGVIEAEEEGDPVFHVVAGLLETEEEVLALLDSLAEDLPSETTIMQTGLESSDPGDDVLPNDVAETPGDSLAVEAAPDQLPPAPTMELGGIDWSQGGWTIVIATETELEKARTFAYNFATYYLEDVDLPVDVFSTEVEEEVEHRVCAGLFATEAEAAGMVTRLADQLPGEARVVQIPKTP